MGGISLLPIIASLAAQSGVVVAEPAYVEQEAVQDASGLVVPDGIVIPPLGQPEGKWDRHDDLLDNLTPPPPPENWRDYVTDPQLIEILDGRRRPGFVPLRPEVLRQDNIGALRPPPPAWAR